jgi:hypothetical protein
MNTSWSPALLASLATLLSACASTPLTPPTVPPALQAPAGTTLYLETLASGVQIYECTRKADATYEWTLKAPEATLTDRSGRVIGKHYAGPTWEAPDGSAAVGEVKARDPGPSPTAIPWLLLTAKTNATAGIFADARYVQRVATVGGLAPTSGCAESTLKSQARVPYSATYVFYRSQAPQAPMAPTGSSAPRSRY